jgi:hypothetical protein
MRRLFFASLFAVAVAALWGCDALSPGTEVRYRISVVINTPDGPRTGSGVWSFKLRPGNFDQGYNSRFRGEAIPVDLPNGKTVFALLDLRGGDNNPDRGSQGTLPEAVLFRHFLMSSGYPPGVGSSREDHLDYLKQHFRSKVQLDCSRSALFNRSECPFLVSFSSPSDPQSVFALNPDRFSEEFGPGYSLAGMYLQITDEGPTHQLQGRLPWEQQLNGNNLDGDRYSSRSTLANSLNILSFKRWDR